MPNHWTGLKPDSHAPHLSVDPAQITRRPRRDLKAGCHARRVSHQNFAARTGFDRRAELPPVAEFLRLRGPQQLGRGDVGCPGILIGRGRPAISVKMTGLVASSRCSMINA